MSSYLDKTEETPELGNIKIPQKIYKFRLLPDSKFGYSKSSGNPMITIVAEIVEPEVVKIRTAEGSKDVMVGGKQVFDYLVLTPQGSGKVKAACRSFGVKPPDYGSPDDDASISGFVLGLAGIEFSALARGEGKDRLDETTGEPILNPDTGEKSVVNSVKMVEYYNKKN